MPFEVIHHEENMTWGIWRIQETEEELQRMIGISDEAPSKITHPEKRLEFYAGRAALAGLLRERRQPFRGLMKDEFGKPFLKGNSAFISLTHSYPYVAAVIDARAHTGIDLEQPKLKLLRIASRVLSPKELEDAGEDVIKHCIYWCAKETLIKVYGRKDLVLAQQLIIDPFVKATNGKLTGSIIANNTISTHQLQYHVYDKFVVVLTEPTRP